jgi:hypothetical protein
LPSKPSTSRFGGGGEPNFTGGSSIEFLTIERGDRKKLVWLQGETVGLDYQWESV